MAEPLALNVVHSLPRHTRRALLHAVKTSRRPSLAANFFTPGPRQMEGKLKSVDSPPLGILLDCHAWACPRSQFALWYEDGPMRTVLLKELAPPTEVSPTRRVRRTSQSSRTRLRQVAQFPTSTHGPRMSSHVHYSTRAARVPNPNATRRAPFVPAVAKAKLETPEAVPPVEKIRKCLQYQSTSQENLDELSYAFSEARREDAFVTLPPGEILELSKSLADHLDGLCVDQVRPHIISTWGKRLQNLLEYLPSSSTQQGDTLEMSLHCRAASFRDLPHQSDWFLQRIPSNPVEWGADHGEYRAAVLSFLLAKAAHHGLYECLRYLWLDNRKFSKRYFSRADQFQKLIATTRGLVEIIRPVFSWTLGKVSQQLIHSIIIACNTQKAFRMSAEIIDEARAQEMDLDEALVLRTCRDLAYSKPDIDTAFRLFEALPSSDSEVYTRTRLYLAGRRGDFEVAKESLEKRREQNMANEADLSHAIASLARKGKIAEVRDLFDEYFPLLPDGRRSGNPDIYHYTNAIQAHVQVGDTQGVGAWLEDMERAEVKPNKEFFTTLINVFKQQGDIRNAFGTFRFMRKAGVEPDTVVYTVLLSILARIKDCDTADALYMQAVTEDKIIPDDVMMNALMNVHVEAASWKETIRLFHHLTDLPANKQPPIDTYNALFKAYLLIGAPFRLMAKLFFKLQDIGGVPDNFTFAILMQSALDARELDVAKEIFEEAERREQETGQRNLVSLQILTMLMSGYLRSKKLDKAKEVFEMMTERGLQPTSVTFGEIIKAYGKYAWEDRMALAEEFVKKLQVEREWEHHPSKRQHLVHFYGPLLQEHAKKGNVEELERLYSEFLEAGGTPADGLLTHLLSCYRLVGEVDKAMEVWPVIRELSRGEIVNDDAPGREMQTRMADIHVPLSIYIDVLSKAGLHSEVSATWSDLQKDDFEFNSHNWNHLCVALVRAGEVERAFEIVERVLLPYERAVRTISDMVTYEEEQTLDDRLHMADGIETPPLEPPMHSNSARAQSQRTARILFSRKGKIDLLEDDEAIDADYAYPFSILQIISPQWNFWRPHNVVLRTLLIAFLQLRRGYLVQPIGPGQRAQNNVAVAEMDDRDFDATDAILDKLYATYPSTIARLQWFRTKEARRLGPTAFEKRYVRR